jgi:hypothetical protein
VRAGSHDDLVALLFVRPYSASTPPFVFARATGACGADRGPRFFCDQFVGGEIGQIVKRLDPGLAQRDQHRFGQVRHSASASSTPSSRRSLRLQPLRGVRALPARGSAIQLGQFFVEAFDRGEFVEFDIGDFFQLAEAFGDQQLRQRLVDVELVLEHFERSTNSRWRFSLASASVMMSIGEPVSWLARRTFWPRRPMASAQLVIGHDHFDAALFFVDHDAADGCRLQRVDDEGRVSSLQGMMSIFSPCISCTTAWTRLPFMPTQAPTGSMLTRRG